MTTRWAFKLLILVLLASAFTSSQDLSEWMAHYYLKPSPERTVSAIQFMAKNGVFDKPTARAPTSAFLGQIFKDNADRLPDWLRELEGLSEDHQRMVWSALWFSNTDQARSLLKASSQGVSAEGKSFIEGLLKQDPPDLFTAPITSPILLDMLWGNFLASGDERCVRRVIEVLPWSEEKGNLDKFLVGGAARWSLTSNAVQHERVLKICEQELKKQPSEIRVVLKQVIKEALKRIQEGRPG